MGVLLQIIGAIVLFVFIAIGLGFLFLWLKMRSFIKKAKVFTETMGGAVPKVSLQFNIVENAPWSDPKFVDKATTELQALGYVRDGDYELDGMKDCYTRGFIHRDGLSLASILSASTFSNCVDFTAFVEDGRVISATNSSMLTDQIPDFRIAVRMEKAPPSELHAAFTEAVQKIEGDFVQLKAGDFKTTSEAAYRREAEWQFKSGGYAIQNLEAIKQMTGAEVDPETQAFLEQNGIIGSESLHEQLIDEYLEQSNISALEWEKIEDDVIFVTENLLADEIIQHVAYYTIVDEEEIRKTAERLGTLRGRDLFWSLVATLGVQGQFQKVYELQEPVIADVIVGKSTD